jgi:hypothetical protein
MSYLADVCSSMEIDPSGRVSMPGCPVIDIASLSLDLSRDLYHDVDLSSKFHGDVNPTEDFGVYVEFEGSQSSTRCISPVQNIVDREKLSSSVFT